MTSPSSVSLDRREWIRHIVQIAAGATLAAHVGTAETWTPKVLTSAQNQALVTLGERIVPGSAAALCNQTIDLVLTMESEEKHAQLAQALATFDSDKDSPLLTSASSPDSPLHPQFQIIKEWISDAYWSSEPGLRELGWTGKMAWSSFPGCETRTESLSVFYNGNEDTRVTSYVFAPLRASADASCVGERGGNAGGRPGCNGRRDDARAP